MATAEQMDPVNCSSRASGSWYSQPRRPLVVLCHRLALWFLRHTARGIELGIFTFMAEAMVISFWVDNATATVVMVSVVNETFSIIQKTTYIRMTQDTSLRDLNISSSNSGEDNIPITEELGDELMKLERMRQTSLIGVGFCATLGGMGMLTADVINLYLIGVLKELSASYSREWLPF
ncbi:hypothetical protein HPB48_018846 [Haemaphysalis longicornis]|uniref:Uncharacterized protein n=1 Tax=Haemaphysalis longicornis TaxID=44386 RepID=A0A9J6H5R7_HAELO|nr:hypothetical protein HPB48_018846 [Haemaphysalis longicornis]